MQISIHVIINDLPELAKFLKSDIPYEHTVDYSLTKKVRTPDVVVQLFYDDFVKLEDWKIKSRTKASGIL